MASSLKFKFASPEAVQWLKSVLNDLNKINPSVRIRITDKNVLLYTFAGRVALKCSMRPYSEVFQPVKDEFNMLDFIFINSKNIAQNLGFFREEQGEVTMTIKAEMDREVIPGIVLANELQLVNGDLTLKQVSGQNTLVEGRLTIDMLKKQLNPEYANHSAEIEVQKMIDIKRLSTLNNTDETIIIRVHEEEMFFAQKKWSLKVADVPGVENDTFTFNRKYLSSIIPGNQPIKINFFNGYISLVEENSYFMIALEIDNL
jgi:hypothetical protein